MKTGAIIQARMGSERLPGKVLLEIAGKPLLAYLLESLLQCSQLAGIVVATSAHPSDEAIAGFCAAAGVPCYRGPLHDVAGRFREVLEIYGFDGFVRICADSPLLDHRLVDKAVALFHKLPVDMVTNTISRTYPRGQSVEVLCSEMFLKAYPAMTQPDEFEHVTPFFYRHQETYRIHAMHLPVDLSTIRFCVDTRDDLELCAQVIALMKKPHWEYTLSDVVALSAQATRQLRREVA